MKPTKGSAKVELYEGDTHIKTITVENNTLYTLIESEEPKKSKLRLVFPDGNIEL
jgi:hypothetical protein